jgi:hypothetical protein
MEMIQADGRLHAPTVCHRYSQLVMVMVLVLLLLLLLLFT